MLSLHVDLNKRKVAEFDEERTKLWIILLMKINKNLKVII